MTSRDLVTNSCVLAALLLAGCGDDSGGAGGAGGGGGGATTTDASTSDSSTSGENTPIPSSSSGTATSCQPMPSYSQADACDYLCPRREELCGAPDETCLRRCGDLHAEEPCPGQRAALRACEAAQDGVVMDCEFTDYEYEGECCQAEFDALFACTFP